MQQSLFKKIIASLDHILYERMPDFPDFKMHFEGAKLQIGEEAVHPLIAAFNQRVCCALLYSAYQGYQANLAHFNNPRFNPLEGEIIEEKEIYSLPRYNEAYQEISRIWKQYPEAAFWDINDYYNYLETSGYRLYHYYGFLAANRILPSLMPNYQCDQHLTAEYRQWITKWFGVDLTPEELL